MSVIFIYRTKNISVMKQLKYSKAPSIIWRLPINPNEKIILHQFAYWGGDVDKKNQDEIAFICGMSKVTVNKCLMQLEKNGYITKGEQKYSDKNKRIALSYSINWNKIESFATATDYFEVKSVNASMDEPKQEEIKTPCVPVEETTERKTIQERVTELFSPIYKKLIETNNTSNYGDSLDRAIKMVIKEYNSDRDTVFELFKTELLKQRKAA